MKLNKFGWQRDIGQNLAPYLSKLIHLTGLTQPLRMGIAYLNYLIGRGAGTSLHMDSEVEAALSCIFRGNPVVFDVGANIGKWSTNFRSQNPGCRLYLFEPQTACQEKIRILNLANAQLICSAVGNETGNRVLYSSSEFDGSASLSERQDSFFQDTQYKTFKVNVIKLDDFIRNEAINFVDFIKFDIEGHELDALAGLRETINRKAVGAFSFEFGSGNLNSKSCFRDFWKLISPLYDISIITPGGGQFPIQSYYEDLEYYRGVSNFVAVLKNHPHSPR